MEPIVMELVVATRNRHKFREIASILRHPRLRLIPLNRFQNAPDVEEKGRSFDANALLKAKATASYTGRPSLADDSGLEVFVLGGRPGIRSARFAGPKATDASNNRKLLRLLKGVPPSRRSARYRCSIALVFPFGKSFLFHGTLSGKIASSQKGAGGFGYDPLFWLPGYRRTVAQIPRLLKNRISHRARALQKASTLLRKFLGGSNPPHL